MSSRTKRAELQGKPLTHGDQDVRDFLRMVADGHERAIEIQDNKGGYVALRWNRDTKKFQVSEDGKTWNDVG